MLKMFKGLVLFLVQFIGDMVFFDWLDMLVGWVVGLGYFGV